MYSPDLNSRIAILKKIELFESVNDDVLLKISKILTTKELIYNETLFNKGDFDHTLYFIVKGCVKAHVGEHIYAIFHQNQYFGEYSLLDSASRSTSVTAMESTVLLGLDQTNFFTFLETNPSLTRTMLTDLVSRLRDYNKLEAELTIKNREISKQKEELEAQRKTLESINVTKDKFFAIIAHDLKNPFSTVLGLSELLAKDFDSFDSEKQKVFIGQIYKYSKNTFNLLENLLQWSMLQTGRMSLRPKLISLSEIILSNIELLRGNALQKGICIESKITSEGFVYVDVGMITTVIRNLLSNAIKFTPQKGQIQIESFKESTYIKVSIKDNGIGISVEDQARLFKIDSNPTTIGTSMEKGTGLGLILCKDFVERHGGTIRVESAVGKGSTFSFTIPTVGTDQVDSNF
ncbi:MAG: cyclic nucleotide-binding domain-containing protein [Bacteroidales bacterium]|nr:cyclic nucleotide-binding domain-containing protein [Bacteroidales bacterium]